MFDGWRAKGGKKNERGRFQISSINPLEGSESVQAITSLLIILGYCAPCHSSPCVFHVLCPCHTKQEARNVHRVFFSCTDPYLQTLLSKESIRVGFYHIETVLKLWSLPTLTTYRLINLGTLLNSNYPVRDA